MTEHDFQQYRCLVQETKYLQQELLHLQNQDPTTHPAADPRYTQLLHKRRENCKQQLMALENSIAQVDDSRIRLILSLRYQKGYSWQKVAFAMGESDESYPRRLCKQFMNRYKQ